MEKLGAVVLGARPHRGCQLSVASFSKVISAMARPNARVVAAAGAVLLAVIAIESIRLGLGGLIVELAHSESDRRIAPGRNAPKAELDWLAGFYADSLAFHPGNPWALEGLGIADLARMRATRSPREAQALARDAYKRFREALRQKPASPYLWSNLALAKLYLNELDDEFRAALRHADELGPWEPSTQEIVLFAGLAAWQSSDAAMRRSTTAVLERGASRNALKLFEIVKRFGRLDLVCPLPGYHAIAARDCAAQPGAGR